MAITRDLSGNIPNNAPIVDPTIGTATNNPTGIMPSQQTVTATATKLPVYGIINSITITAKAINTGPVFIGGPDVNTTDTGTGTGYKLVPGQSIGYAVANANNLWIIGTAADVVYLAGN